MVLRIVSFLLISILLFSSCATYQKQKAGKLKIISKNQLAAIYNTDTIQSNKQNTIVIRTAPCKKHDTLAIKIVDADKVVDTLIVSPKLKMGLAISSFGLVKEYFYPTYYVDFDNKPINRYKFEQLKPSRKGLLCLSLSLPHVNNFVFKPYGNKGPSKSNTGFLGIAAGLGYYHSNNQYIDVQAGGIMDFLVPVPAPFDFEGGEHEAFYSTYLSVSNNNILDRFSLGYGVSLAKHSWLYENTVYAENDIQKKQDPVVYEYIKRKHTALGLNIPLHFIVDKNLLIGIIYKPYLYQLGDINQFSYQHTISFEFKLRFGFRIKRNSASEYK